MTLARRARYRGALLGLAAGDAPGTTLEFYRRTSVAEGALLAVNLGDDADTTGAVYGQLAGAFYGEAGHSGELAVSAGASRAHHGIRRPVARPGGVLDAVVDREVENR